MIDSLKVEERSREEENSKHRKEWCLAPIILLIGRDWENHGERNFQARSSQSPHRKKTKQIVK
jgi:hypothetical protein